MNNMNEKYFLQKHPLVKYSWTFANISLWLLAISFITYAATHQMRFAVSIGINAGWFIVFYCIYEYKTYKEFILSLNDIVEKTDT